jgi:hypothetical protein
MTETPAATVDAALDYLAAALAGEPTYAEAVAVNYGTGLVARGLSTLLVMVIIDAAEESESTPEAVVATLRERYARQGATP